jgi:hypothetical protein
MRSKSNYQPEHTCVECKSPDREALYWGDQLCEECLREILKEA